MLKNIAHFPRCYDTASSRQAARSARICEISQFKVYEKRNMI